MSWVDRPVTRDTPVSLEEPGHAQITDPSVTDVSESSASPLYGGGRGSTDGKTLTEVTGTRGPLLRQVRDQTRFPTQSLVSRRVFCPDLLFAPLSHVRRDS